MTTNQAEQWQRALASYRYPINGTSELLFGAVSGWQNYGSIRYRASSLPGGMYRGIN